MQRRTGSDTSRKTELTNCLKDIEEYNKDPATYVPKFCKNLFQKIDGTLFAASCKDGKTEPTPTGSAIRASSGSILSKLIGWSGGGNRITGNSMSKQDAGNIITGHVSATPTTCTIHESTTTPAINTCTDIPKGAVTQVWHCDSKAKAENCGNKIMYTELTSAIKTHDICQPSTGCKKVECSICGGTPTDWCYENECTGATSISKNRESLGIGTCKFVDNWPPTQDTCEPVQTTAQKKSEAEKAAEKVLEDNKGKAVAFGKTAVVCDKNTDGSLKCDVKAFELPQYVKFADANFPWPVNIPLKAVDLGLAWIGATGSPKYLVYYEVFPPEAESWWMYGETDPIVTVFATGAILNLGPSGLKIAGTTVKSIGKAAAKRTFLALRGGASEAEKALINREMKTAISSRLAKEFGGKLLAKYTAAVAVEDTFVGETVRTGLNGVLKKRVGEGLEAAAYGKGINDAANTEFANAVKGAGVIEKEFVADVLERNGVKKTQEELEQIAGDLNYMQSAAKEGSLIEKGALSKAIKDEVGGPLYKAEYVRNFKSRQQILNAAMKVEEKKKIGVMPALKWIADKIKKKSFDDIMAGEEKTALASLERIEGALAASGEDLTDESIGSMVKKDISMNYMFKSNENAGTKISETILAPDEAALLSAPAKAELDSIVAAWYNSEGSLVKSTAWERAGQMMKGAVGLPPNGLPSWKRQAVLASTLAASIYFMMQDAQAEKYQIHQNTITLYRQRMLALLLGDDPAKGDYLVQSNTKDVKSDMWVQMKIPKVLFDGGMPLMLASPCKTDLKVTYGTDSTACKCKDFYTELSFRLEKIKCVVDTNLDGEMSMKVDKDGNLFPYEPVVPVSEDGVCPTKVKGKFKVFDRMSSTVSPEPLYTEVDGIFPVLTVKESFPQFGYPDVPKPTDPPVTCKLKANEKAQDALKRCFDETVKGKVQYTECYGRDRPTIKDCSGTVQATYYNVNDGSVISWGGGGPDYYINSVTSAAAPVTLIDTVAVPLNLGRAPDGTDVTYKVCTEQGSIDSVKEMLGDKSYNRKCVKIEADAASMTNYKTNSNMDENFCRINDATFGDFMTAATNVGLVVADVALIVFPPTTGLGAALATSSTFVAGGVTAVAEKEIDINKVWPASQGG